MCITFLKLPVRGIGAAAVLCYHHPDVDDLSSKKEKEGANARIPFAATVGRWPARSFAAASERKASPLGVTAAKCVFPGCRGVNFGQPGIAVRQTLPTFPSRLRKTSKESGELGLLSVPASVKQPWGGIFGSGKPPKPFVRSLRSAADDQTTWRTIFLSFFTPK